MGGAGGARRGASCARCQAAGRVCKHRQGSHRGQAQLPSTLADCPTRRPAAGCPCSRLRTCLGVKPPGPAADMSRWPWLVCHSVIASSSHLREAGMAGCVSRAKPTKRPRRPSLPTGERSLACQDAAVAAKPAGRASSSRSAPWPAGMCTQHAAPASPGGPAPWRRRARPGQKAGTPAGALAAPPPVALGGDGQLVHGALSVQCGVALIAMIPASAGAEAAGAAPISATAKPAQGAAARPSTAQPSARSPCQRQRKPPAGSAPTRACCSRPCSHRAHPAARRPRAARATAASGSSAPAPPPAFIQAHALGCCGPAAAAAAG
jgi:hypothetical protein